MKIISCHIENFGRLQNFDISFDEGITIIKERNGFGKTTLANFIRCMFYGMPRASKDIAKNLRKHYQPWQGGVYGGSITFELNGCTYRIERTFDRTPADDTCLVFDVEAGKRTDKFGEDPGLSIFGLDAESFERSTYMPQCFDGGSLSTASIQAKLGNLVEDTSDIASFDAAIMSLQDERRQRKSFRGQSGTYYKLKSDISSNEEEIARLKFAQNQLDELLKNQAEAYSLETRLKDDLSKVRGLLATAAGAKDREALFKHHEELVDASNISARNLMMMEDRYPDGIPEEHEMMQILDNITRLQALKEAAYMELSDADAIELASLRQTFASGVPTDEDIYQCRRSLEEAVECQKRADEFRNNYVHDDTEEVKKDKNLGFLILIGVILMAVGSIGVMTFYTSVVQLFEYQGLVSAGVAGLGFITAIAGYFIGRRENKHDKSHASLEAEARELRIRELESQALALRNDVKAFVTKYGVEGGDMREALYAIQDKIARYAILTERERSIALGKENVSEPAHEIADTLIQFFEKYNIPPERQTYEAVNILKEDVTAYAFFLRTTQQTSLSVRKFEMENGSDFSDVERALELAAQYDELKEHETDNERRLDACTKRLVDLSANISSLGERLDNLPQLMDELENQKAALKKVEEEIELIDKTIQYLNQSREIFSSRFLLPIRDSFDKYLRMMKAFGKKGAFVDTDLNISFDADGKVKEVGYLSAGYNDMINVCMRMALVDALYTDVKPFVILDDPFINLDEAFTKRALLLLKELAQDRQIIYLVCHQSRVGKR